MKEQEHRLIKTLSLSTILLIFKEVQLILLKLRSSTMSSGNLIEISKLSFMMQKLSRICLKKTQEHS